MVSLSRRLAIGRMFGGTATFLTLGALKLAAPILAFSGTALVCKSATATVDDDVGSGVQLELSLEKRLGHIRQVRETPEGAQLMVEAALLEAEKKGFKASVARVESRLCVLVEKIEIVDMKQDQLAGLIAVVCENQKEISQMLCGIAVSVKKLYELISRVDCKLSSVENLICCLNKELACLAQAICCLKKEVRGAIIWAFVVGIIIGAIGGSFITCGGSVPPAIASVPIW